MTIQNPYKKKSHLWVAKTKQYLASKWYLWTFLLGMLFALAFCPYSWVLYFGALIPLVLKSSSWLLLPSVFAPWTSIPVLIFIFILAFSTKTIGKIFGKVSKVEKIIRYIVAGIFIVVWVYYLQYTVQFLLGLF